MYDVRNFKTKLKDNAKVLPLLFGLIVVCVELTQFPLIVKFHGRYNKPRSEAERRGRAVKAARLPPQLDCGLK